MSLESAPSQENLNPAQEVQWAHRMIAGIFYEMYPTGAMDEERGRVAEIVAKLDKRDITPREAVRQVENMRDERQLYH